MHLILTAQDYYLFGQASLLTPLLPYSAWAVIIIGMTLLGFGKWYQIQLSSWFRGFPSSVRKGLIVMLLVEGLPALTVGLVICLWFGASFGSGVGRALMSFGGLLPGTILERIGGAIGWFLGGLWGVSASFVTMEVLAAVLVLALYYITTKIRNLPC